MGENLSNSPCLLDLQTTWTKWKMKKKRKKNKLFIALK